jgi:hypothetical protein
MSTLPQGGSRVPLPAPTSFLPALLLLVPTWVLIPVWAAPASAQSYHEDIRPVLSQNCLGCHTADGPGWSMEDPEETYRMRYAIAAAILDRRMPPWIAEAGHQSYHDDPSLGAAVLAMVSAWRDADFPRGEPGSDPAYHEAPAPGAPGAVRGAHEAHAFQPDLTLEVMPGQSYLPNQDRADDYRCFVVDWPLDEPGYVTGFRAVPGNLLVAHHVVVHAIRPEMVDRYRELEEAEEGLGYQCFGGSIPDRLGNRAEREAYEERYPDGIRELSLASFWLAHWAPGMDGHRFPAGTGIPMDPGSAVVVQMHYYGLEAPGERDEGTRIDFQVAHEVERPAFHLPQTRNAWLVAERNGSMIIEPGQTATYELSDRLGDLLAYVARVTGVEEDRIGGLEIHSANLHMHAFGHSGVISLRDPNGRKEILLSVPRWDLRWQRDFTFVEPKVFTRDDLGRTWLSVECTFRNPTDEMVYGGYGSFDEMCFNFSYIAVRPEGEGVADRDGRE